MPWLAQDGDAAGLSHFPHLLSTSLSLLFPITHYPDSHQGIKVSLSMFSQPNSYKIKLNFYRDKNLNTVVHYLWGTLSLGDSLKI